MKQEKKLMNITLLPQLSCCWKCYDDTTKYEKESMFHTSEQQIVEISYLISMQNWFALCVDSSNND
jgi:hypothetical protein